MCDVVAGDTAMVGQVGWSPDNCPMITAPLLGHTGSGESTLVLRKEAWLLQSPHLLFTVYSFSVSWSLLEPIHSGGTCVDEFHTTVEDALHSKVVAQE